jgi:hypothetical protein
MLIEILIITTKFKGSLRVTRGVQLQLQYLKKHHFLDLWLL